jgi:glyoxylase-like metal-dependent hydrolase (beta-lactamase superfamily II)
MIIETLAVGPLQVNCHIIGDEKSGKAMVVDPGGNAAEIMSVVNKNKLTVEYIALTHGHFDHIGAIGDIRDKTGAKVLLHQAELELYSSSPGLAKMFGMGINTPPAPNQFVKDGDTIRVGTLNFKVMHMPGHSPGGIALYGEGIVLTGDTLFAGSIGRTDLPASQEELIWKSLGRLIALPEDTKVLCGHGPDSTIGCEKRMNPFVGQFE